MIGMPRALVDTATINLGLNIAVKKYLQGKKIYYTIFFALKRVSITFHLPSKWCRKTRAISSKILLLKSIIFSFLKSRKITFSTEFVTGKIWFPYFFYYKAHEKAVQKSQKFQCREELLNLILFAYAYIWKGVCIRMVKPK